MERKILAPRGSSSWDLMKGGDSRTKVNDDVTSYLLLFQFGRRQTFMLAGATVAAAAAVTCRFQLPWPRPPQPGRQTQPSWLNLQHHPSLYSAAPKKE